MSKDRESHVRLDIDKNAFEKALNSDLLNIFYGRSNKDINPYYLNRSERNIFAATELEKYPIKTILNLGGGGNRHLQTSLSSAEITVHEIDIQGDCDLHANLDDLARLPFDDASFDVTCAFDVLEHLENFHLINEEIYRVAKDFVLISLPNSTCEIFIDVIRNRPTNKSDENRGTFSKFYGLPPIPPNDRHRWWLYFQDIIRFYYYFSLKHKTTIEFWTPALNVKKRIFKRLFGAHLYYTFFCSHVWVKIEKR